MNIVKVTSRKDRIFNRIVFWLAAGQTAFLTWAVFRFNQTLSLEEFSKLDYFTVGIFVGITGLATVTSSAAFTKKHWRRFWY